MIDEPVLDIDDIQGHILIGFRGGYQRVLGLKYIEGAVAAARSALLPWLDQVTSTRQALAYRTHAKVIDVAGAAPGDRAAVLLAIAVTAPGLVSLQAESLPDDPDFIAGAAKSAATLRDPVDTASGSPIGWQYGDTAERTPDLVVIFGGDEEHSVRAQSQRFLSDVAGHALVIMDEWCARIPGEKEHFGFVDGISQPAPRGVLENGQPLVHRAIPQDNPASKAYSRPGRPLIWPGQYVFGYPSEQADSLLPGPASGGGRGFLRNGSLLVLRRLRQDVDSFQKGMARLADKFTENGLPVSAETAAAWCVGRWPDGSPLSLAPLAADPTLAANEYLVNGFLFGQDLARSHLNLPDGQTLPFPGSRADANGYACPFFAHIRKVNPRDDPVDFGGSGVTRQAQMLRRGVPYGPRWSGQPDGEDRGLMFMAYQTSISNQFHRLMKRWVNDNFAPLPLSGIDPVIGVDAPPGRALERRRTGQNPVRLLFDGTWVRATGGVYAFTPGISQLRKLITGLTS